MGSWPFIAPGTVVAQTSTAPLHVTCKVLAGAVAQPSNSAPNLNKASATSALIGGGTIAALWIASATVFGPAAAVALAAVYGKLGAYAGAAIGSVTADAAQPAACEPDCANRQRARLGRAQRLKRFIGLDLERCPNCGNELKIIAAIRGQSHRESIRTICVCGPAHRRWLRRVGPSA